MSKRHFAVAVVAVSLIVVPILRAESPADRQASEPRATAGLPITISKETTYITEPLRADGYPDYLAALNRLGSEGVTPENNAAVLLVQALGPEKIPSEDREEFFKMLGIAPLPENGDYFVTYLDYVKAHAPDALNDKDKDGGYREALAWRQYYRATRDPWSKETCPLVAGWLAESEKSLLRVVEASNRSHFHVPVISQRDDDGMSFGFPVLSRMREAVTALRARGMLRLQDCDPQQAWDDFQTCHRLSRLVAQGPTPNEWLIAVSIDNAAYEGDWQIANFSGLTPEQSRKYRAAINRLPTLPSVIDKYNSAGRSSYLGYVCATARGSMKPSFVGGELRAALMEWIASGAVDWDQMLRWGNEHVDRMVEVARKPTWRERLDAAAALDQEVEQRYTEYRDAKPSVPADRKDLVEARRHKAFITSGLFAVYSEWLLGPVTESALEAENRLAISTWLTDLAFALASYRIEHGRYPEKLDSLTPEYLARVPEDPYGKGTFPFRLQDGGYVLYSVGPNGRDDTGPPSNSPRPEHDETSEHSDDIGIRMPGRIKE
jgi:hypothetical protein